MSEFSKFTIEMKAWLKKSNIIPTASKFIDEKQVDVFIIDDVITANSISEKIKDAAGGGLFPHLPLIGFDTETYINRNRQEISFSFKAEKKIIAQQNSHTQFEEATPLIKSHHSQHGTLQSIPSMIQIAVSHHLVFIFRCFVMCFDNETKSFTPCVFPIALSALLKSPQVTKIGVAASRDAEDLQTYFGVKVHF